jgi:hypothetical protein
MVFFGSAMADHVFDDVLFGQMEARRKQHADSGRSQPRHRPTVTGLLDSRLTEVFDLADAVKVQSADGRVTSSGPGAEFDGRRIFTRAWRVSVGHSPAA